MFIILIILIIKRENIATPSRYIFVLGDEVFNIVRRVFLTRCITRLLMRCSTAIYPLGIFLHLLPQSILRVQRECNKNETSGRQKISSIHTTLPGDECSDAEKNPA